MSSRRNIRVALLEFGAIIISISVLGLGWWLLFSAKKEVSDTVATLPQRIEVAGSASIPYFLLAVDRSASMKKSNSDPENFEREALKQVLRIIYSSGKHLFQSIGQYPRIRLISFSGAPQSVLGDDKWHKLSSKEDIDYFDVQIDSVLEKRTGQFTDINAVIEKILGAWKSIPKIQGEGKQTRPTSMIAILFTDGEIYPNFLNPINHDKRSGSWPVFSSETKALADRILGAKKGDELLKALKNRKWLDPIDWAFQNSTKDHAGHFKTAYYRKNENDGLKNHERFTYARNVVQKILHKRLVSLKEPPVRLNVIALIKGAGRETELKYLDQWVRNLGFSYHIEDASNLENAFIDIMSDYLNSYSEKFSVNGIRYLDPFSNDVVAAQLSVVFQTRLSEAEQNRLFSFYSPTGIIVNASLNSVQDHSRGYFISKDNYKDFYDNRGWRLEVHPISVNGKMIENVNCFLTTIHDYVLDVKADAEYNVANREISRYIVRLVSLKDKEAIALSDFAEIPRFSAEVLHSDRKLPDVVFSQNPAKDGMSADFIGWPSGIYDIKFRLLSGKLKGQSSPFRTRSLTTAIEVGERIWLYDDSGKHISSIKFEKLDRK